MTTTARPRPVVEADLVEARATVEVLEERLAEAKARRGALVVEIRKTDPAPSARATADLAGISAPWVRKLEEEAAE